MASNGNQQLPRRTARATAGKRRRDEGEDEDDPKPQESSRPTKKPTQTAPKPKTVQGTVHKPEDFHPLLSNWLAEKELRIDYTHGDEKQTLITRVQVLKAKTYKFGRTIEAAFWIDEVTSMADRCGKVVSYAIYKKKEGWIGEFLDPKAESSAAESLKELYDDEGLPKENHEDLPLDGETIVYLDSFKLTGKAQGKSLSNIALEAFHLLLAALPKPYAFSGTVILSPAYPDTDDAEAVWGDKTTVEVEKILIRAYAKAGYEVLIKGDEKVEGSITVLGRVV